MIMCVCVCVCVCVFNKVSSEKMDSRGNGAHEHTLHVRWTTAASVYNAVNFQTTTSPHSASDHLTSQCIGLCIRLGIRLAAGFLRLSVQCGSLRKRLVRLKWIIVQPPMHDLKSDHS